MCWALYLASENQFPQIPWDKDARAFHTQELSESDLQVKKQFSLPYVIYLGSHLGCGCGFMKVEDEDQNEQTVRQETVTALSYYLENALNTGAHLEMFLCWEGDQTADPIAKKLLSPRDFLGFQFPLAEKEFANIIST